MALGVQHAVNAHGVAETYSRLGPLDELIQTNAFFKDMGNTGRTCNSCHSAAGGWTPSASQELWDATGGTDPLFMFAHDAGTCPEADVSNPGSRRQTHQLTLERGNARGETRSGGTPVSDAWEFSVVEVVDPFNCKDTSTSRVFRYREPNPVNSISQKSSITWTGAPPPDMRDALRGFMVRATQFHGLTTYVPTEEEQISGAMFMENLFFAQIIDNVAGRLDEDGAKGGPVHLSEQEFFVGINDSRSPDFNPRIFNIYDAWIDIDPDTATTDEERAKLERRRLIAEGQETFNSLPCGRCHNSPNVGGTSQFRPFDIGTVDIPDPNMPSIRIRNKATGEERVVMDFGRATLTGKWSDVGRMSAPILRGLSGRAPYMANGQLKSLKDVIDHYDNRFKLGLSGHQKNALVAFLAAL